MRTSSKIHTTRDGVFIGRLVRLSKYDPRSRATNDEMASQ